MNLEIKQEKGLLLVKPLDKSIEATNSRDFKGKIMDLINQGNKMVILNLSKVEFIDSSGLGSLISVLKSLTNSQGKIAICEAQDPVIKVFTLTRLNQVFQFFPQEQAAINSLTILTS